MRGEESFLICTIYICWRGKREKRLKFGFLNVCESKGTFKNLYCGGFTLNFLL